ncbi:MAG: hypothetical protein ACE14L_08750 [Terriglobales bacterium]
MKLLRSHLLKRGSALVLFVLAGMVSGRGAARSCLTPDPNTCKIPEDCFYKRQIAMKRALRDSFASSALRCKALENARRQLGPNASDADVNKRAAELLYDDIANNPGRIARRLPRCNTSLADPPGWETAADCSFSAKGADGKWIDPESVNTCSEFMKAARDHERVHVAACKAARDGRKLDLGATSGWVPHGNACAGANYNNGDPKVPDRDSLNDFADEEADAYTEEIWRLEDERAAAIRACTTAREAAKAAANASKNAKALSGMKGAR